MSTHPQEVRTAGYMPSQLSRPELLLELNVTVRKVFRPESQPPAGTSLAQGKLRWTPPPPVSPPPAKPVLAQPRITAVGALPGVQPGSGPQKCPCKRT